MGIVRAMKHATLQLLRPACGFAVMLAMAPLAGAQTPATMATPPAPAAAPAPPAPPELSNDEASYLFGLMSGEQLHAIGLNSEVSSDAFARGVHDALQGKKSTQAEKQQVQQYAHSAMLSFAARNKASAQEFLTRNGHEKNVKTTPTGLQYKVLIPGDAKAAPIVATDEVIVNYRGKLLDGTEFDSSYSHGQPLTIPVGGVIKGWQEALVLMKPGAKWELYIPPELAYGPSPRPGIPANSLLIFQVELMSVKASGGTTGGGAPQGTIPQAHRPAAPAPPTSTPPATPPSTPQ
jgi:FKBP-type peptidyl-prolyl cis-trans isomerase FklB